MVIEPLPLPPQCYRNQPLDKYFGIVVHYVSARFAAPQQWDVPQTIHDMLVDLNHIGEERGLVLPQEPAARQYASYHYMVDRTGHVYELVPPDKQAYHAGVSRWGGEQNLNRCTLGVAFIATPSSGYTDPQYANGQQLCAQLMSKYRIQLHNVVGHEHAAPGRKRDPGPAFDWVRFKEPLRDVWMA